MKAARLIGVWLVVASVTITGLAVMHRSPKPPQPQSSGGCHVRGALPDPVCTPGVVNPNVGQANINQTICVKGWTATIRPPQSYTAPLKQAQMKQYGFTDSISNHEEDHLISLELGGHPTDPKNLWPEPGRSPNPKDSVENQLRQRVCAGTMSLSVAQQKIATNWQTALK